MTGRKIITNAEAARMLAKILSPAGSGWCKGTFTDPVGRHCLSGAWMTLPYSIHVALARGEISGATFSALARIIREQYPERILPPTVNVRDMDNYVIVTFNDHPDTTFADILSVLEKLETAE